MVFASGLGIGLSLVFGCLLLALIAELYYLLWWKKLRITTTTTTTTPIEENCTAAHTKELFYLFCWNKPPNPSTTRRRESTAANSEPHPDQLDIELGSSKEFLLRAMSGDHDALVEAELMRIHNRFLFTIKEETKEDLESEDGRSKASRRGSRTRSLSDLILAVDTPIPSPTKLDCYSHQGTFNPLFESRGVLEAEMDRLRSSPPPSFKFLRDAEEKLYRRLVEEAEKMNRKGEREDGSLIRVIVGKNSNGHHSSSSQVLPLSSSPTSESPPVLDPILPGY